MAYVPGVDKIDESAEWAPVLPSSETEIPHFGEKQEEGGGAGKTPEELEQERIAAEAAAGKTPEELEQERIAAEAAAGKTPEQLEQERVAAEERATIQEEARKKFLKDLGFESEEDIKNLKKKQEVPETAEEKTVRLEKQEADFQQYAVANNKMSLSEITSYKQLSAMPPQDLVYADFANEFRNANKDRQTDGTADPVTDEEIKEEFEAAYHTKSESALLKSTGERAVKARAAELLAESEKKYNTAKGEYEALADRKAKMPEFKTFVQGALTAAIPEKYKFTVEGREFSVELDKNDFKEIEDKFKNDQIFARYYDATNRQGLQQSINEEAQRQLAAKYLTKVAEVANTLGYEAGVKFGKIGAKAPFVPILPTGGVKPTGKLTEEDKADIRTGLGQN